MRQIYSCVIFSFYTYYTIYKIKSRTIRPTNIGV